MREVRWGVTKEVTGDKAEKAAEYLNKTSNDHREYAALDRVSVESLPQQHSEKKEVTKESNDDEDRVEKYDNN